MLRLPKAIVIFITVIGCGTQSASASCQLVSATHSALTRTEAAQSSQLLAAQKALELKWQNGWPSYSMRAHRVTPNPFWKAVRPVVPVEAVVGYPIVTPQTHTICWTGVVVPYVCTSGSLVCAPDVAATLRTLPNREILWARWFEPKKN
jgi:hypothetical protein